MKPLAAILASLAALSLLAEPIESTPLDMAKALPDAIAKALVNASPFGGFSHTLYFPMSNISLNASTNGNIEVNSTVIPFGPTLFHVIFDLDMPDFTIDGNLTTEDRFDNILKHANFLAVAKGNLTLSTESLFNIRTRSFVVRNNVKSRVDFFTDFSWTNCQPTTADCRQTQDGVSRYLSEVFLHEYKERVRDVLFQLSPRIAKNVVEADDGFGGLFINNRAN